MKKKLLGLFIIPLALTGCGGGKEVPIDDDPLPLIIDTSEKYDIDETVTNKNSSMSYEIFVRSFYDTNNNGVGDFNGVTLKLPYLKSLGIKTVWLMPIQRSISYHGYDITDYYSVHPDFGTLADFDKLIEEANKNDIDIMMDLVINHCSPSNPWVEESYQDFKAGRTGDGSKADWFEWSVKSGYKYKDIYFASDFTSDMINFNLDSVSLREELEKICKFWIEDHGVKGFRLDAAQHYYGLNVNKNNEFLTWLSRTTKKYNPSFYMVGECLSADSIVASYYKSECESFFKYGSSISGGGNALLVPTAKGGTIAKNVVSELESYENTIKAYNPNGYSSYYLSNHDQDRVSSKINDERTKCAASLLALMPGTPFMYYGEEIALLGKRCTSPDDYSDARRRLPMIWSENDKTGECMFPEWNRPDLAYNDQVKLGVDDQLKDPFSLLNHYKKAINVRNKYPFLKMARFKNMVPSLQTEDKHVVAYKLYLDDQYIIVVHNFNKYNVEVTSPGVEIVDSINTTHRIPSLKEGLLRLGAGSTVILK